MDFDLNTQLKPKIICKTFQILILRINFAEIFLHPSIFPKNSPFWMFFQNHFNSIGFHLVFKSYFRRNYQIQFQNEFKIVSNLFSAYADNVYSTVLLFSAPPSENKDFPHVLVRFYGHKPFRNRVFSAPMWSIIFRTENGVKKY